MSVRRDLPARLLFLFVWGRRRRHFKGTSGRRVSIREAALKRCGRAIFRRGGEGAGENVVQDPCFRGTFQ